MISEPASERLVLRGEDGAGADPPPDPDGRDGVCTEPLPLFCEPPLRTLRSEPEFEPGLLPSGFDNRVPDEPGDTPSPGPPPETPLTPMVSPARPNGRFLSTCQAS